MIAPEVIIISPPKEEHAQVVYQYLCQKHKNLSVSILDTSHFPKTMSWHIGLSDAGMKIEMPGENSDISLEKIRSIWWWRPQAPVIDSKIQNQDQSNFAYRECCQMMEGLWYILDCLWVNQPERQEVAMNRLYQLDAAKMVGFKIPETIFTNHPETVREFWEAHHRQIVYRQMVPLSPKTFVFTEREASRLDCISLAPVMFQEIVKLDALLYILVIGEALFPIRVFHSDGKQYLMKKYLLPNEVKLKVLNFTRQTGLLYGRMSMGIDKNSNYVFLELNPTAPFLEIERELKIPLTEIMSELLVRGRVKETQRFWPTLPKYKKLGQNE